MERLQASPGYRSRVEAAERLGISLKRFDGGWVPTTTYLYDDAGRLVSSAPDLEWDEEQQAVMVALGRWRALACHGCGGWLPETTDPGAAKAYVVEKPVRCHRCSAFAVAAESTKNMSMPQSLLLQVSKREG